MYQSGLNQENRNSFKHLKWGEGVFIYGIGIYGDGRAEKADRRRHPFLAGRKGREEEVTLQPRAQGPRGRRNHSSPVQ